MQADGKIVVTNSTNRFIAVTRFNQDGTIDGTYGEGGTTSTVSSNSRQSFRDISETFLTKNNELIVVSTRGERGITSFFVSYYILKFDANGKFVNSYSESNNAVESDYTESGALDDASNVYITTRQGFVFKLDANLDLDTTFAENGLLRLTPSQDRKVVVDNKNGL